MSKQHSAHGIDKGGKGELERSTHDCIKHILMSQIHLDDFSLLDKNKPMLFPIFHYSVSANFFLALQMPMLYSIRSKAISMHVETNVKPGRGTCGFPHASNKICPCLALIIIYLSCVLQFSKVIMLVTTLNNMINITEVHAFSRS